jgi:hypothetical protein
MLATLDEQIACAERELRYRIRLYPKWIEAGKITSDVAGKEQAAMRAILDTLMRVKRGELLI